MRVSPDGRRYAYVERRGLPAPVVRVVDPGVTNTPLGEGQDPRWASTDEVWWRPQTETPLRWANGSAGWAETESFLASGNSLALGGASRVARHRTDPVRVLDGSVRVLDGGVGRVDVSGDLPGCAWPVLSDDGRWLVVLTPDQPRDRMQSVRLYAPDGSARTLYEGAVVEGTQGTDIRMAGTTLCFKEADGRVYGIVDVANPDARPELLARAGEGVSHACPVYVPSRGLYVLHVRAQGDVARVCLATWASMLAGAPLGVVLATSSGGGYEHDARLTAGTSRVLCAWLAADGAPQARALELGTVPVVALAFPPAPFAQRVLTPKALGYFFDRWRDGDWSPRRNCTVTSSTLWAGDLDGDGDQELPEDVEARLCAAIDDAGAAFLAAVPADLLRPGVRARWGKVLGLWTHEPDTPTQARAWVAQAASLVEVAKLARRPVITILREERSADPEFAGIGDALAPEIYFTAPEATYDRQLGVARARIDVVCRALDPSPLYLCIQAFDRRDARWAAAPWALEAIQQAGNEALDRGQVRGLWWFAYGRPGGVVDYPSLERWHAVQVAATPAPAPIADPPPITPPKEPSMPDIAQVPKPGQAEYRDFMTFLHEVCYQGELQRAGGLFESPDPQGSRIFDGRKPKGEVVMDDAAMVWLGEYTQAWFAHLATPGGPHEAAKAHVRRIIHNSDEARTKRGETSTQPPPTGELAGPLSATGRDIVTP